MTCGMLLSKQSGKMVQVMDRRLFPWEPGRPIIHPFQHPVVAGLTLMSPKGVNLGFMMSAPGVPELTRLDVLGVAVRGGGEKRSSMCFGDS